MFAQNLMPEKVMGWRILAQHALKGRRNKEFRASKFSEAVIDSELVKAYRS
jgi:hypothetical protein